MRSWLRALTIAGVLVVVGIAAAGCGGSSSPAATTTPSTNTPGAATTATAPATTESTPATASPDDAAFSAIRAAYETFFNGAGSDVDTKVAVLQDGDRYRSMLADASADPQFQSLTIDIRDITLATADQCAALGEVAPCALVTFDLLVGGMPALVGQQSAAVEVDGKWLVAASAWCTVVAIGGETCP